MVVMVIFTAAVGFVVGLEFAAHVALIVEVNEFVLLSVAVFPFEEKLPGS